MMNLGITEIALRLGIAALFGMMLGLDRQFRGKSAGLRTHMLIALGAAATTIVTFRLYELIVTMKPDTRADPLRVIEGVMAAIGFLGAGALIRGARRTHNMTTAADIWLCGAIGLACGAGEYGVATVTFAFTFIILTAMRFVERRFSRSSGDR